jgi:radical SAM superfamily enzyme YgiQ (UPF0313 family)
MKIALISPRSSFLGRNEEFKKLFYQSPEMEFYRQYWSGLGSGLLVIAALTPKETELKLIDENIEEIDHREVYDLVAITAMTQQATRAYKIADNFRERGIKVVLGGIHPTVLPDEAGHHGDSIIVGEAENSWKKMLEDLERDNLKSVYTDPYGADLTQSPIPKYELLEQKPYKIVWIQTSRGCPHDCGYCCASRVYGFKYRHKTISRVVEEIHLVRSVKKHALIGFADDNLFSARTYARKLLEKITGLGIRWIGQSDISVAYDRSLLSSIKKSGCVALLIGLESVDEKNLKGLDSSNWKLKQLKNYEESIRTIQDSGVGVIGTFIVGFDNDDSSVFERLANFIIDNHLAGAQIAALTPFPGTWLRKELLNAGRILDTPWENYTFYDVNIKPKLMSTWELEKGVLAVFKKIYSPSVAAGKIRHFKNIFSERYAAQKEIYFNNLERNNL